MMNGLVGASTTFIDLENQRPDVAARKPISPRLLSHQGFSRNRFVEARVEQSTNT